MEKQKRTYHLGLVVSLLALDDILGRDSALGQINVALLLVDSQDDDNLVPADADQLLDTSDASSRQLAEQDHAVDVVVLEQFDVCAHLGNLVVLSISLRVLHCCGRVLQHTCLTLTMTNESISGYFSS